MAKLLGQPVEKMGDAQWIGHILKRLHLLDDARRKRGMDGMTYAIQPTEVIDMMRRYDVAVIHEIQIKPFIPYIPYMLFFLKMKGM